MYLHTEVFRIILTTIFRIKPTQAAWIPICYNKIEKKKTNNRTKEFMIPDRFNIN